MVVNLWRQSSCWQRAGSDQQGAEALRSLAAVARTG